MSDKPAWVQALPPIPPGREEAIARNVRGKLASLAAVDEGIRQVIEAIEATGEQDETVLVFTSDNGYLHGEHRFPSGKEAVYEPAIRAPFYVAGPGFEAETAVPGPITFTDLAPTLAGLAGATLGLTSDGRTLHETMADPEADRAILVLSGIDIPAERQFTAVRTMRWLYATYPETGDVELYDLRDDPHELESRHADEDFREQRAALEGLLAALTGCAGHELPSARARGAAFVMLARYTAKLMGNEAIHAAAPRKTMQPMITIAARAPGLGTLVLIPAKKRATANRTTAST